jgi:hypothetical protein
MRSKESNLGSRQPLLLAGILKYVSGLRFPWLLAIVATLFAVDLVVPDLIPWIDELLLGLVTVLLAAWRKRKTDRGVPTAEQRVEALPPSAPKEPGDDAAQRPGLR